MKWFDNLKMIQKLVAPFVFVALFIGIVGFIGMISMNTISKNSDNIYSQDLVGIDAIHNLKSNSIQSERDILLAIDHGNQSELKEISSDFADMKTSNDTLILAYKATITNDSAKKQFAEFEKSIGRLSNYKRSNN